MFEIFLSLRRRVGARLSLDPLMIGKWGTEGFLSCLDGMMVNKDEEDKVCWTKTKNRKLTVKSLYMALEPEASISFSWSNIWKAWVHPRVSFFSWEAT